MDLPEGGFSKDASVVASSAADSGLSSDELSALRHIVSKGSDLNLRSKRWVDVKTALGRRGLLRRRPADWAWVPTETASQFLR